MGTNTRHRECWICGAPGRAGDGAHRCAPHGEPLADRVERRAEFAQRSSGTLRAPLFALAEYVPRDFGAHENDGADVPGCDLGPTEARDPARPLRCRECAGSMSAIDPPFVPLDGSERHTYALACDACGWCASVVEQRAMAAEREGRVVRGRVGAR